MKRKFDINLGIILKELGFNVYETEGCTCKIIHAGFKLKIYYSGGWFHAESMHSFKDMFKAKEFYGILEKLNERTK